MHTFFYFHISAAYGLQFTQFYVIFPVVEIYVVNFVTLFSLFVNKLWA